MTKRSAIPSDAQTEVFRESGRRCCICFALHRDSTIKQGQIAHVDQDRSNNKADNLVFLCLPHHDQYDSSTSQSKNFTQNEVRTYRRQLSLHLQSLSPSERRAGDVNVQGDLSAGHGSHEDGGDVIVKGGTGHRGASGGNVNVGPGNIRAGDGGSSGAGGNVIIKGGDAK